MKSNRDLKAAYGITIISLLVAVVCYAIPVEKADKPVRKMFKCLAGKVLFTHEEHFDAIEPGYGISCEECHHHHEEDEANYKACGDCHAKEVSNTVQKVCLECHKPDENHHGEEAAKYSCNDCHKLNEGESIPQACADCHESEDIGDGMKIPMNMQNRTDAFHNQCINCHKEYGEKAPIACSSCHVQ